jgi:hypothetical protein
MKPSRISGYKQILRINVVCKTSWHAIARLRIRKHQRVENIGMYENIENIGM